MPTGNMNPNSLYFQILKWPVYMRHIIVPFSSLLTSVGQSRLPSQAASCLNVHSLSVAFERGEEVPWCFGIGLYNICVPKFDYKEHSLVICFKSF